MTTTHVAFVTGGASGIGRAVCERLASQGISVAVADLDGDGAASVAATLATRAMPMSLDVKGSDAVRAACDTTVQELGPISILVNCAGVDIVKPFIETTEDEWEFLIDVNLTGVLRTTHAVLPGMIERGRGTIINIASDAGRVGSSGEAVYAAAKAGVIAFTKTVARETARYGIRANCVAPGPTDTPQLRRNTDDNAGLIEALTKAIPLRRLARPEEIAGAVSFLAGDDAAFITGQTLSVSGGLTMS